MSNRILVMQSGRIVAEMHRDLVSEESITAAATGQSMVMTDPAA